MYDLDSDGFITRDEMCNILDSICLMLGDSIEENKNFDPKQRVDQIFKELDTVSIINYLMITIAVHEYLIIFRYIIVYL